MSQTHDDDDKKRKLFYNSFQSFFAMQVIECLSDARDTQQEQPGSKDSLVVSSERRGSEP